LPPTKATFCASVTSITCEDVKDFWLFRRPTDPARSNFSGYQTRANANQVPKK